MAVRPIILYPESWLKQKSAPVLLEEFGSDQLRELVADLAETMVAARGVGLAAPQIGVHKRVVVVPSPTNPSRGNLVVLCNPVLSEFTAEMQTTLEGCLSLPGVTLPVKRPVGVKLKAQTVEGVDFEAEWSGFAAIALQHECDHLDGKTIADNISYMKKQFVLKQLKKTVREMQEAEAPADPKKGPRFPGGLPASKKLDNPGITA